MKRFRYRAISGVGDVVTGTLEAGSRNDAVRTLRQRSLDPVSLREGVSSSLLEVLNRDLAIGRDGRLRLRRDFARDLALLREAGAPLDRALAILGEGKGSDATLAQRIAQRSQSGMALSAALRLEPRLFDEASVALVAAGEASGEMAMSLRTLGELTDRTMATRSEMIRSLAYPAVLVLAALLAIGLMVFHVLPSFEALFSGAEQAIPQSARLVFAAGAYAREAAVPVGIATLVIGAAAVLAWSTENGRRAVDSALLRLPGVGRLLAGLDLARAMLIAGRLLAAGATADRAVELAAATCANTVFRRDLQTAAGRIREGTAVAPALAGVRSMPLRAVRMIAIGESSGALPRMLNEVAGMLDGTARAGVRAILSALPPVLTAIVGLLVGGLVYAVLTALLSVNELAI